MKSKVFDCAARMATMADPLFDQINRRCREVRQQGRDLIDLGQAVPDFSPPNALQQAVTDALPEPRTHHYTADLGIPELRNAVAEHLQATFGVNGIGAENIVITAGANHGFQTACICLIDTGDRVGLLSPYFVNHHMAIQGCGGVPVEIMPDEEFCYSKDTIRDAVRRHDLRAIVLVNPSNPTGKAYSKEELLDILEVCRECDLLLLSDEVYREFVYGDAEMVSIGSLPGACEHAGDIRQLFQGVRYDGMARRLDVRSGNADTASAEGSGLFRYLRTAHLSNRRRRGPAEAAGLRTAVSFQLQSSSADIDRRTSASRSNQGLRGAGCLLCVVSIT